MYLLVINTQVRVAHKTVHVLINSDGLWLDRSSFCLANNMARVTQMVKATSGVLIISTYRSVSDLSW